MENQPAVPLARPSSTSTRASLAAPAPAPPPHLEDLPRRLPGICSLPWPRAGTRHGRRPGRGKEDAPNRIATELEEGAATTVAGHRGHQIQLPWRGGGGGDGVVVAVASSCFCGSARSSSPACVRCRAAPSRPRDAPGAASSLAPCRRRRHSPCSAPSRGRHLRHGAAPKLDLISVVACCSAASSAI